MGLNRRDLFVLGASACLVGVSVDSVANPDELRRTLTPWARSEIDPASLSWVDTGRREVAVTFDDGPDPAYTPAVLDVLARFGVHATFFAIGRNVEAYPALAARIVAEGHELANHTQDHLWLHVQTRTVVERQVEACHRALTGVLETPAPWFRPPKGLTTPVVAQTVQRRHLREVFWTDSIEAHSRGRAADAARLVVDGLAPGGIVLTHDGGHLDGPNPQAIDRSRSVEALPHLLAGLERRGLAAVTVSRLTEDR